MVSINLIPIPMSQIVFNAFLDLGGFYGTQLSVCLVLLHICKNHANAEALFRSFLEIL
jgi:hypothetical protein